MIPIQTVNNITILHINSKRINGILDLDKYPYLELLNCSNNYIIKIINYNDGIKKLCCNRNNIKELNNLPR